MDDSGPAARFNLRDWFDKRAAARYTRAARARKDSRDMCFKHSLRERVEITDEVDAFCYWQEYDRFTQLPRASGAIHVADVAMVGA